MKRLFFAGLLTIAIAAAGSGQASAATLTVCPSGCAYSQIAPAVAAAKDGDTISVAPGTYNGGFTIDVSVKLTGTGPPAARSSAAAAR
jgi:nitrous oxidase accessory protein NosD